MYGIVIIIIVINNNSPITDKSDDKTSKGLIILRNPVNISNRLLNINDLSLIKIFMNDYFYVKFGKCENNDVHNCSNSYKLTCGETILCSSILS
jgi:hypothetical protein